MWVCGVQREISVAHTVKCPDILQLRVDPIFPAWVKFSQWGTGGDTEDFVIESCQDVHGWHNNKLSLSLSFSLSSHWTRKYKMYYSYKVALSWDEMID